MKKLVFLCLWCCVSGALNGSPNYKYSFEQCLVTKPVSIGTCIGIGALSQLQSMDDDPAYNLVDGVTFLRDEHRPRDQGYIFERTDPTNFRMIVDTIGSVMSARTLQWDMGTIYPGLMMRITPSVNGVLEFIMDPHQETIDQLKTIKDIGTGKLITRQILLPLLLGIKFKVATLVPIIFGILAILAKKAIFVSKIALVVSSSIALGSVLFGSFGHPFHGYGHEFGGHGGFAHGGYAHGSYGHGGHGGYGFNPAFGGYKVADDSVPGGIVQDYSGEAIHRDKTLNTNEFQTADQIKFQQDIYENRKVPEQGRNFAWNEDEKGANS